MSEYTEQPGDEAPTESAGPAANVVAPPRPRGKSRQVIGPFTLRHLAVANTMIAVTLVVLFVVTRPLGASSSPGRTLDSSATFYQVSSETQGLEIGQRAPDFVGTGDNGQTVRLTDLDGHPLSMADLKGHPVWINFWATWCPPCQKETPVLRDAYEAHRKDGLVLVAVSIQEEPATVRDYVNRYGLQYTIGMDVTAAIMHAYRVFGIPTHYFIDRTGVVRDRVFGPLDRAGAEQRLAEILKP